MSREINEKINDLWERSLGLRNYKTKYNYKRKDKIDKGFEIDKKQNELYKKWLFMKNLNKAIEKGKKDENNK